MKSEKNVAGKRCSLVRFGVNPRNLIFDVLYGARYGTALCGTRWSLDAPSCTGHWSVRIARGACLST